jgi:hypothetical protein
LGAGAPIIRIIRSKSFWTCVGDFIVAFDLSAGKYFSHGFGRMFAKERDKYN